MQSQIDESMVPNQLLCPIYQELMKDPVITVDGFTFERKAIQSWFMKGKNTNPLTNKPLTSMNLLPNRALRQTIENYNVRMREMERDVNKKAEEFMKISNASIAEFFPGMVDQMGLVDFQKIVQMAMEIKLLRNAVIEVRDKFQEIVKVHNKNQSNCAQCQHIISSVQQYKNYLNGTPSQLLHQQSLISTIKISLQTSSISYLMLNNEQIKAIDFKRLKKKDLKKYQLKGVTLQLKTVGEIVKKIRGEQEVPYAEFVNLWVPRISIGELYEHILKQTETITGRYIKKVKGVGTKLTNMGIKIYELKLTEQDYLIVEHGHGEEYVFREGEAKCDNCYKFLKVMDMCQCKKVLYCSKECKDIDQFYHQKVCVLNNNNGE